MEKRDLLLSITFIAITVILVIYFWKNSILLFSLLAIISIIELIIWKGKFDLLLYFVPFIVGPPLESLVITFGGAWVYSSPDFFNIPLWLFPLWGLTGLNLNKFVKSLFE